MIAGLATIFIMVAALLIMFSGVLPSEGGKRLRAQAGHLILFTVLMLVALPFVEAFLRAVPPYVIVGVLLAASLAAFVILESRRRHAPRPPQHGFVSYRASGKVPVHEAEPLALRDEPDGEAGAEPDELL
jgi:hypothetical protein